MKAKVTRLLGLILILILAGCAPGNPFSPPAHVRHKVCIDAGHGGEDSGKLYQNLYADKKDQATALDMATKLGRSEPTGHYPESGMEKTMALDIAGRLATLLKKDYEVIMTRDPAKGTEDKNFGNSERAVICNDNKAEVLLSIHLNAPSSDSKDTPPSLYHCINYSKTFYGMGQEGKDLSWAETINKALEKEKLIN